MKKTLSIALTFAAVLSLLTTACGSSVKTNEKPAAVNNLSGNTTVAETEEVTTSEMDKVRENIDAYAQSINSYTLSDGVRTVVISSGGSISSVSAEGITYLQNAGTRSFAVKADRKHGNIWETDPDAADNNIYSDSDAKVRLIESDGTSVTLYSSLDGVFGLLRRYELKDGKLTVQAEIRCDLKNGTLISVTPAYVEGMVVGKKPLNCAVPYKEG